MPYEFATQDQDYSDFASGRVLYSLPGLPAFPVRLASEIFLRGKRQVSALKKLAPGQRLALYDPTCGGAYHLAALGMLHGTDIAAIFASDVDERAVGLARRNLGLLSPGGLERREQEIQSMLAEYGKESHAEALRSLAALRRRVQDAPPIRTRVFQENVVNRDALQEALAGEAIDLVISDIPYGKLSAWKMPAGYPARFPAHAPDAQGPLWYMLDALLGILSADSAGSVAAIAADKAQKIAHPGYRRVERFQIGKRQVSFLTPARS